MRQADRQRLLMGQITANMLQSVGKGGSEGGAQTEVGGIKGSFGYWCRFELSASRSCFVERTTVNKLVNGKFTAPACGLIKSGDGEDDENDCDFVYVLVGYVWVKRGVVRERE